MSFSIFQTTNRAQKSIALLLVASGLKLMAVGSLQTLTH